MQTMLTRPTQTHEDLQFVSVCTPYSCNAASLSCFILTGYSGPINGLHLLGMNYRFGASALGIQPQLATMR